jgi:hypothetical protein
MINAINVLLFALPVQMELVVILVELLPQQEIQATYVPALLDFMMMDQMTNVLPVCQFVLPVVTAYLVILA